MSARDAQVKTVTLDPDLAAFVDAKIKAGAYDKPDDVVAAGLRALRDREAGLEDWLRGPVAATYDGVREGWIATAPPGETFRAVRASRPKAKGR